MLRLEDRPQSAVVENPSILVVEEDISSASSDTLVTSGIPIRFVSEVRDEPLPEKQTFRLLASGFAVAGLLNFAGVVPSHATLSRTYGSISALEEDLEGQSWELKNLRRAFLIRKRAASDLTTAEEAELRILQGDAYQRAKAKHALPFSTLEALEALVRDRKA